MATKKKDALAKRGDTLPANWKEEMAAEARQVAAREVLLAPRISLKNGVIRIGDQKLDELNVIVADFTCEKTFHEKGYVEGENTTPVCFAFGDVEADLKPHPTSAKPQAENCATCPHNRFGTADQGKGKACRDHRRLMVLPGDVKPDDVPTAESLMLSIPPTSIKGWATYIKGLKELGRTPWSVITNMVTGPLKSAFGVFFKLADEVDGRVYMAIKKRQPALREQLIAPYPPPSEESEKPKAAKGKAKKGKSKLD